MKKGLDYAKDQVQQFHKAFGHPIGEMPTAIPTDIAVARTNWTAEELVEFLYATAEGDKETFVDMVDGLLTAIVKTESKILKKGDPVEDVLVAQMDALTDVNYFVQGSFVVAGVNPQPLFDIVQNANMAKLWPDGKPHTDPNNGGKIIKPLGWEAPEPKLLAEINRQKGKTKFKVGDKVIVRNDLVVGERYGMESNDYVDTFIDEMEHLAGKEVTILEVDDNYGQDDLHYHVTKDIERWNWTDEMFEDKI